MTIKTHLNIERQEQEEIVYPPAFHDNKDTICNQSGYET